MNGYSRKALKAFLSAYKDNPHKDIYDHTKLDNDALKQSFGQSHNTEGQETEQSETEKKETENKLEVLDAEKNRKVAEEKNKQSEDKAESESKIVKINAESDATKKRIDSDANSYALSKLATDNKLLLTPEYIQLKQVESFGCNNAIYYGDSIPTFMSNQYNSGNNPWELITKDKV